MADKLKVLADSYSDVSPLPQSNFRDEETLDLAQLDNNEAVKSLLRTIALARPEPSDYHEYAKSIYMLAQYLTPNTISPDIQPSIMGEFGIMLVVLPLFFVVYYAMSGVLVLVALVVSLESWIVMLMGIVGTTVASIATGQPVVLASNGTQITGASSSTVTTVSNIIAIINGVILSLRTLKDVKKSFPRSVASMAHSSMVLVYGGKEDTDHTVRLQERKSPDQIAQIRVNVVRKALAIRKVQNMRIELYILRRSAWAYDTTRMALIDTYIGELTSQEHKLLDPMTAFLDIESESFGGPAILNSLQSLSGFTEFCRLLWKVDLPPGISSGSSSGQTVTVPTAVAMPRIQAEPARQSRIAGVAALLPSVATRREPSRPSEPSSVARPPEPPSSQPTDIESQLPPMPPLRPEPPIVSHDV